LQALKIVSLFDGISCGRAALERAGYAVSSYAAFEIDKFARAISRHNYPDITQHGDVMDANFSQFRGYDLVMGGSPCTFWSIAKANREVDKNGMGWALFMRFVEAIREVQPRYFLYENVASMPAAIKQFISEELGCEPVIINSALVSAQQRKRLYWTNIPVTMQPVDQGILLRDILESGLAYQEKSHCFVATYAGAQFENSITRKQRTMVAEPIALKDKSNTLCANFYKENNRSLLKRSKVGLFVCAPVRVGIIGNGGQGSRIYSVHGKTVSLMANGGGHGGISGLYKIDLPDGDYTIRKLTPIEAERCQTLPDDYTALGVDDTGRLVKISNTQRYKAVGNGWTVDVISHILKNMEVEKSALCASSA
jgi:DNA (cytosine-5)-methyltransferase 3A